MSLSQDHTCMPVLHTLCQCHCLKTTQACQCYTRSVSATVSRPHRHASVTHALSVPLSRDHTGMPVLHTLCQCHCLETTQACQCYTRSVSATVSRPHRHASVTHALSVPLSQDHTGMPVLHTLCQCHCLKTTQACQCYTRSVSATVSRPHRHAGVTHALSVPLSQDHTGMPVLHTLCQCHCLKTTQACRCYTRSVSATVSRPHRHAGVTHALSVPLSRDHTGMPVLHTLCQCHCLKTTQACRCYTRSVSATVSRPHRHAGVTHALSVPLSQDHTGMPVLHTLCQCHCLKTTQACQCYTRSVSATVSRPHRHASVTHALSVLCQCHCLKTTQACQCYTRSVSATVSRPHRHASVTHALSVPLSQDHTGMPVLHTLCQCHCLKTTQACRCYTRSVSATVSRPHRHAGVTHALSVPLSQDHTGMPVLHTLCQCHCLKTTHACRCYTRSVSATVSRPHMHASVTHALSVPLSQDHTDMPVLHTLCQCHCLKTTQACRCYTRSVSATVSRPHRHASVTHALSVPLSQDHTCMPRSVTHGSVSATVSRPHRHAGVTHALSVPLSRETTQACRCYTRSVSATVSRDHTGMPVLHTLCQCHCLKTTQACRCYTRSVSATVSRPHRHAGVTHALSVPLSQDHTGMPVLHTLCQCHCLKTTQACRCYTRSVSATVSRPHRHAGVTHALSVPLSQDHTGMPVLHTLCQCHCLKTTHACQCYTRSVSATVSRPHRHAGVTHALSVPLSQDHTGMPVLHTLCQCHCLKTTQACRCYTRSVSATVSRPHRHAGVTHALSVPLSQDHTGMPVLHTLCQCHSLKTTQACCQCHCLKTTQACQCYTRSVSATVSRPHRHAGVTHALSVHLSQEHTSMPVLHVLSRLSL